MLSILSKQMTEPKRLMKALRTRPLETPAMAALNDVLRVDRMRAHAHEIVDAMDAVMSGL